MRKLAFFRDEDGWGLGLYVSALQKGVPALFFDDDEGLDEAPEKTPVFVRMSHKELTRQRYKNRVERWSRSNPIVPGQTMGFLYDNKLEQQKALGKYMPHAYFVKTEEDAYKVLRNLPMPFVSKTPDGAGSKGCRFIKTSEDAIKDVSRSGGVGKGYLLWQKFCPGNAHDYRCLVIGAERLWMKRYNRDNSPFASGSGRIEHMEHKNVPPLMRDFVERFVVEQSQGEGCLYDSLMPFFGIDLIYDDGKPVMTEVTTSWTLPPYFGCTFLDGRKGYAFFDVVVEQMVKACQKLQ